MAIKKIGSLSLLKFSLAFITFLFHWNVHFSVVYSNALLNKFINAGAFAMCGFFVLSGFLLFYIYSEKNFSDFDYLKNFYVKRAAKILPSCYLIVLIMLALQYFCLHKSVDWVIILMQIIPLQAYFPNLFSEFINGGLWFVSVLLFLYFLFPLLCFIVKNVKHIFIFAAFVYILGVFPLIVDCYYPHPSIYHLPYFRIAEFIMGMIAARAVLSFHKEFNMMYSLLTSLVIFFSVGILYSNNFFHHMRFGSHYLYYDVVLLILFPVLIYFLATTKNKYFLLIMQNKFVDYLGCIAYSFFLTQMICQFAVRNYLLPNFSGLTSLSLLVLSLFLNLILAIIMYEFFEKPVTKKLSSLLNPCMPRKLLKDASYSESHKS